MKEEIVYETKNWEVILASKQLYLGRCVIIIKRDCPSLSNLNKEEWNDLLEIIKKLESALKKTFNATMFNWTCLMNNAYKSKNPQPQVHLHFRPRYNHEVNFAERIFKDPNFAKHYDEELEYKIPDIEKDIKLKIIKEIQKNILK